MTALPPAIETDIIAGGTETTAWRETLTAWGAHGGGLLGGDGHHQPLAPLGATPLENVDAVFVAHPGTKAVGPFTTDFTRLVSTFHGIGSLLLMFLQRGLLSTDRQTCQGKEHSRPAPEKAPGGRRRRFPLQSLWIICYFLKVEQNQVFQSILLKKQQFKRYQQLFINMWINTPRRVPASKRRNTFYA